MKVTIEKQVTIIVELEIEPKRFEEKEKFIDTYWNGVTEEMVSKALAPQTKLIAKELYTFGNLKRV